LTVDKSPDVIVVRVEDMPTILIDQYALIFVVITIARYVFPFLDDQTFLSMIRQQSRTGSAEHASAHNQKVVHHK